MPYLSIGLLTMLGVTFGVSAWSKVRNVTAQRAFAASLRPLGLLPDRLVGPVAAVVTGVELLVAVGLGWATAAAVWPAPGGRAAGFLSVVAAAVLLAVLTLGVAVSLRRGGAGRCRCFGGGERPLSSAHLLRNGLLLVGTAAGLSALAATTGPVPELAGVPFALAAGTVAALLLIRVDDLVDLFAPSRSHGPISRTRN